MSIDFTQAYEEPLVTTSLTALDEGEVSLRPKRLDDYTGQEKAKENLRVYIEAAKRRSEPLDHVLLYGPPGLGKTDAGRRHCQRDGCQYPHHLWPSHRQNR